MKSIYLAGKIAQNDWRHDAVPELRGTLSTYDFDRNPPWPKLRMLGGNFNYVGPYFTSCDHGCAHADGVHGVSNSCMGQCPDVLLHSAVPKYVMTRCFSAIRECDIFFAWLGGDDAETAHGTLVELGVAKASGKHIIIASDRLISQQRDLWFAFYCLDRGIKADHPLLALEVLNGEEREKNVALESPIEEAFWQAYLALRPAPLEGLMPQHQVQVADRAYRLDFALASQKIGIELDGYQYHGTSREQFVADQQRQRALEAEGWRLIRFAGAEVYANAYTVVQAAADHVRALGGLEPPADLFIDVASVLDEINPRPQP